MTRRSLWLALSLTALLGGGAWYAQRLITRHSLAASYIPPVPQPAKMHPALAENIATASNQARSWLHATAGLALLSRLYHANGFYPEAITCYEGLRLMEPRNARWPHLQANIISSFGRMDEALPLRELTVALAPNYTPGRLRLGDVLLKDNRAADAANTYAEVLRRIPGEPYALLGLARCALSANDWVKAREHLQAAIGQHPDFAGAQSLLVTVSEHFQDNAAAKAAKTAMSGRVFSDLPDPWFDEISDVCFDPYLLSVAASTVDFAGNRPAALELIERAIALAPENSTYRRQAGQFYLQDHNFSAAKVQLEKAVEVNPTDSDSWLRYLDAVRGLNQNQAIVNILLTGLSHCPQSSGLHLEYARWLRAANRLDEAISEFRYAYQLRPSEAAPLIELATAYISAGRSGEAMETLQLALVRQPDHPMALATLVFLAINSNDEGAAQSAWLQMRRQPNVPIEMVQRLKQAYQQQFGRPLQ